MRRPRTAAAFILLLASLGAGPGLLTAPAAEAAPGPFVPGYFGPDVGDWVFVTQFLQGSGNMEQAYVFNPDTGEAIPVFPQIPASLQYDAIGYRVADHYIYGIHHVNGVGDDIVRIGLDGTYLTVVDLGAPKTAGGITLDAFKKSLMGPSLGFGAGSFGMGATADKLFLGPAEGFTSYIFVLDFSRLQTSTGATLGCVGQEVSTSCLPTASALMLKAANGATVFDTASDIFWADGYLWGVHSHACPGGAAACTVGVYRYDINHPNTDGSIPVSDYPLTGLTLSAESEHGFGSQWVYANGDLGFSIDHTPSGGMIYRFTIREPDGDPYVGIGDPVFALAPGYPIAGPLTSNRTDGTSSGIAVDLKLGKTVDKTVARPGDPLVYTLKVTNNETNPNLESSGWVVTDVLPAGFTIDPNMANVQVTGTGAFDPASVTCSVTTDPATSIDSLICKGGLLAPGEIATIVFAGTIKTDATGALINEATVKGYETDKVLDNNPARTETDLAEIALTKTPTIIAGPSSGGTLGATLARMTAVDDEVTYTFTATNTGAVTLNDVTVTEGTFTGNGTPPTIASCTVDGVIKANGAITLAPGQSAICVSDVYYVVADDLVPASGATQGQIDNHATVTGVPAAGDDPTPVTADADAQVLGLQAVPSISLLKEVLTPADQLIFRSGQTITYKFTITNDGDQPLNNVYITDPHFALADLDAMTCDLSNGTSGVQNGHFSLNPGRYATCTSPVYTVTTADMAASSIVNTATVTADPDDGVSTPVTDTSTVTLPVQQPRDWEPILALSKTADVTSVDQVGAEINYTFTVANTSQFIIQNIDVAELTAADTDDPAGDPGFSGTGTAPIVAATCLVGPGTVAGLTNPATATAMTDGSITLRPGEVAVCLSTAPYAVTVQDLFAGWVTNWGKATGAAETGTAVLPAYDDAVVGTVADPSIVSAKTVDHAVAQVGDELVYTITITNDGNIPMYVGFEDGTTAAPFTGRGAWTPPVPDCTIDGEVSPTWLLEPGKTLVCVLAPYTVVDADAVAGSVRNTEIASGVLAEMDQLLYADPKTAVTRIGPVGSDTGGSVASSPGCLVAVLLVGVGAATYLVRRRAVAV